MSNTKYLRPLIIAAFGILLGFLPFARLPKFSYNSLSPIVKAENRKTGKEVFGFAPYWTINKLQNVDFNVLTTFAYFGIPVKSDGELDNKDYGYEVFKSDKATALFKKAHDHGTRVVVTLTSMDNSTINALMDDSVAQRKTIDETVALVKQRGIDGVNIDFEYVGDPGQEYRNKFTKFVTDMTTKMHKEVPDSRVTVSVYASAVIDPKIYDLGKLADNSDGIFMMAYDFATLSADNAIPTSPLYGAKDGKYWYDVATAVEDFLTVMPANKLILGVPWYGYDYLVYEPSVKAATRPYWTWRGDPAAATYSAVQKDITPTKDGAKGYQAGWDDTGKVGWKAYYVAETDTWRMVFFDDVRSLSFKYDFAKDKKLAGVGIWALGFDDGHTELWDLLNSKFGTKMADRATNNRIISQRLIQ